jgi:hypothetical protein
MPFHYLPHPMFESFSRAARSLFHPPWSRKGADGHEAETSASTRFTQVGAKPSVAPEGETSSSPTASELAYGDPPRGTPEIEERPAKDPLDLSLNEARALMSSETSYESQLRGEGGIRESRASGRALTRLAAAQRGIEYLNREVFIYGAGNQLDDIVGSKGVSRIRTERLRNPAANKLDGNRDLTPGFEEGMHATKAEHWHAGVCDDYAKVMMDWLRTNLPGEKLTRVAHDSHAFVIIGDRATESADELVVADPWPTRPQACSWKDHFCYTTEEIKVNVELTADGKNAKQEIAPRVHSEKKPGARGQKLGDDGLQSMLTEAREKNDIWFQRTTTDDGKAVFYVDPTWTNEERAQRKEAFIQSLLRAQHLNANARKRLGV